MSDLSFSASQILQPIFNSITIRLLRIYSNRDPVNPRSTSGDQFLELLVVVLGPGSANAFGTMAEIIEFRAWELVQYITDKCTLGQFPYEKFVLVGCVLGRPAQRAGRSLRLSSEPPTCRNLFLGSFILEYGPDLRPFVGVVPVVTKAVVQVEYFRVFPLFPPFQPSLYRRIPKFIKFEILVISLMDDAEFFPLSISYQDVVQVPLRQVTLLMARSRLIPRGRQD